MPAKPSSACDVDLPVGQLPRLNALKQVTPLPKGRMVMADLSRNRRAVAQTIRAATVFEPRLLGNREWPVGFDGLNALGMRHIEASNKLAQKLAAGQTDHVAPLKPDSRDDYGKQCG